MPQKHQKILVKVKFSKNYINIISITKIYFMLVGLRFIIQKKIMVLHQNRNLYYKVIV
jgi:hypothetical protein